MRPSRNPDRRHRRVIAAGAAALLLAVLGFGALSSAAVTKSHSLGVGKTHVGSSEEPIAVNTHGVPVYELSPETTHHFLCTMSNGCLSAWPPVKVAHGAKLSKGAGLQGRLGTFKRNGFTQLTLNGHPVYTFVEDGGHKGTAHGDKLHSFHGIWHVFKEGRAETPGGGPSMTTSTTTSSPAPIPGY
jgi:predicted lipoprotein with Yx(FWY)xxD motif